MKPITPDILNILWYDNDAREGYLRRIIQERINENPPPHQDDSITASYFFAFRSMKLDEAVEEISYHATSGIRHPTAGTLLDQCSAKPAGVDSFDDSGRIGLLHVAFPLKMMLQPDGHITSCDILHTVAAAIVFDVFENQDSRLISLNIPDKVIQTFPGPAYGPGDLRKVTGFRAGQPAFGTILKPTAGITPEQEEQLVSEIAGCPLFMFVKEDEDLYPNLDYAPLSERTRKAVRAIERSRQQRNGLDLLFAPHISSAPHEILDNLHAAIDGGASAVMFSETFAGGTVRMVREATRQMDHPPAIYGHNAGIGVKIRGIWREVIDLLARLDGIDLRQTAPVKPGPPFLKPYGLEWEASEKVLTRPIPGIKATMIARAGALDQGNIGLNLADAEKRGLSESILFLAGSAINSIKNDAGKPDPRLGADAMLEAIEVYHSGELADIPVEDYVKALASHSEQNGMHALRESLRQRYHL